MPTYEYICPNCGKVVEYFHAMHERPQYICDCGARFKLQISGGTNVLYKAKGFTKYKGRV